MCVYLMCKHVFICICISKCWCVCFILLSHSRTSSVDPWSSTLFAAGSPLCGLLLCTLSQGLLRIFCLHLPFHDGSFVSTDVCYCILFYVFWGFELESSHLYTIYFIHWALSQVNLMKFKKDTVIGYASICKWISKMCDCFTIINGLLHAIVTWPNEKIVNYNSTTWNELWFIT